MVMMILLLLSFAGVWKTDYMRHVVMDEADTLLDDSFSEKVLHFISKIPVSTMHMIYTLTDCCFNGFVGFSDS